MRSITVAGTPNETHHQAIVMDGAGRCLRQLSSWAGDKKPAITSRGSASKQKVGAFTCTQGARPVRNYLLMEISSSGVFVDNPARASWLPHLEAAIRPDAAGKGNRAQTECRCKAIAAGCTRASKRQAFADGATLVDSYEALPADKPSVPIQRYLYGATCKQTGPQSAFDRVTGTKPCSGPLKLAVCSTQTISRMCKISGIVTHVERMWLISILRSMDQQRSLGNSCQSAIAIDGPFVVLGSSGWLRCAVRQDLCSLNGRLREELIISGIETALT